MIGKWFRRSQPTAADAGQRIAPPMIAPARRRGARLYQAAQADRVTSGWSTSPLPADQIVRRNWRALVARSREQLVNNSYAKAFQRSVRRNVIGQKGFILQAQVQGADGKPDADANRAIEAAFKKWSKAKNCDVKGVRSFLQIQKTLVNGLPSDGEFMVRHVYGRDAGPWGYGLQILDPVNCPVDFDEDRRPNGRFIRAGIEYTKMGRPVYYYFHTLDVSQSDYSHAGRAFIRVPADQIIHWFEEDLVGQKRGLPWMATALLRMRQLDQFERAALINARESANKLGVIEWDEGFGPEPESDDDDGEAAEVELSSEAGIYHEMLQGQRLKRVESPYPNGEMAVFSKHNLRGVASGLGAAYNDLANDLEGVNLSSMRHGMQAERDRWKELQESLIESFISEVFEKWLEYSLIAGKITLDNGATLSPRHLSKYLDATFHARRWDWMDPSKDVKADADAVENLFKSRGQVIRERGRNPRDVYREFAEDIQAMKDEGIPPEIIAALITAKSKGGSPSVPAVETDPDETIAGGGNDSAQAE
jgi:lambda family phage portal protein